MNSITVTGPMVPKMDPKSKLLTALMSQGQSFVIDKSKWTKTGLMTADITLGPQINVHTTFVCTTSKQN